MKRGKEKGGKIHQNRGKGLKKAFWGYKLKNLFVGENK